MNNFSSRLFRGAGALMAAALLSSTLAFAQADPSKTLVIMPFESSAETKPGFLDQSRTSVAAFLKENKLFADVQTADAAKGDAMTLSAKLVEFKAGNMATRVMVGMGSGRASAAYDFTLRDAAGKVVWMKTIKEKASVWSNNASSTAQRLELPEKIAGALVKELKGKK